MSLEEAKALHTAATQAQLSRKGLETLTEIGRLADQFKADEIDALRFTVCAGLLLANLEAAR